MDSGEPGAVDIEELTLAVGQRAAEIRAWTRAASRRHRVCVLRTRAVLRRAALARERSVWLQGREQAEIDRESRSSARRMAYDRETDRRTP